MTEQQFEYDPEVEEIDVEIHTDPPAYDGPQADHDGLQDDGWDDDA